MRKYGLYILIFLCVSLCGCRKTSYPRPYGYRRIVLPAASYSPLQATEPYIFEISDYATWQPVPNKGDGEWKNIHYDVLNADIHCSYMPIQGNLRELTDDAVQFVPRLIGNEQSPENIENSYQYCNFQFVCQE